MHYNVLIAFLYTLSTSGQSATKFDENKIKFFYWDENTQGQPVSVGKYGNFTKGRTKFLIYGSLELLPGPDIGGPCYQSPIQKLLKLRFRVVCVDWSYYLSHLYVNNAGRVNDLGKLLAYFILGIVDTFGAPLEDFHIIGHSAGAHAAGFAGKHIQNMTNKKIGRITGLDPAVRIFNYKLPSERLAADDATNVDTIVTYKDFFSMAQVNFWIHCGGTLHPWTLSWNYILAIPYFLYSLDHDVVGKQCECDILDHLKNDTCLAKPTNKLGLDIDFTIPGNYHADVDPVIVLKHVG